MKTIFLILMICGILFSGTTYDYEFKPLKIQETGDASLKSMNITGGLQCIPAYVLLTATDNGKPVYGAKAYLFYTEGGYKLRASGETDLDGKVALPMTGANSSYLTHLFVIRVDKIGEYKSKEMEFVFDECIKNPIPQPKQNTTQNTSLPVQNTSSLNTTIGNTTIQNTSLNTTNQTNSGTVPAGGNCTTDYDCEQVSCPGVYTPSECKNGKCTQWSCPAPNGTVQQCASPFFIIIITILTGFFGKR